MGGWERGRAVKVSPCLCSLLGKGKYVAEFVWGEFGSVVFTVSLFPGDVPQPSMTCKKLGRGLGRQGRLKEVHSSIAKSKPLIRAL